MTPRLVLGVDAGGTSVRALLADDAGRRLGVGRAGGANPISRGLPATVDALATAIRAALGAAATEPGTVEIAVLGMAGTNALLEQTRVALDEVWQRTGLSCPRRLIGDAAAAFAAGTAAPDGVALICGTGAIATEIRGGIGTRQVDGAGWLLGDVGSGFWLGHHAARAVLAALDGRGEPTALVASLCAALGVSDGTARARITGVIEAVHAGPPIALAELGPLVPAAAAAGDAVAQDLVDRAVEALAGDVAVLLPVPTAGSAGPPGPTVVVLAGSGLVRPGPLRDGVRARLAARPDVRLAEARDGAAGACWWGLRALLGDGLPAAVHAALTTP